ncbi:type II 3-dehydroquinate dehydratase [Limnohabitans sp. INBF002]|jgi:3-dehydroquinate dehydratase-2|uniref:type II 3-dehydroquinate dehydratase n=1 Tax=Limnohabitans sp. INBF002 TaxID=2986280 RepID=UPI002377C2EE|nr:type II 3-dehydroquinate dehydratase [Limnohabitans sp. INBF002]BDU52669.1 3-dehydroquinate dehydratase [Limnohabitans sp. INBF002]
MTAKKIFILNGPNLNRLGTREPHIYGKETLVDLEKRCRVKAKTLGLELEFRQTNFEGVLVESVHDAIDHAHGIIINPAGLTFTSVPIMDSLKMFDGPKVELHISNVHTREAVYHNSLMSKVVTAVMAGFGTSGYLLALDWMAERLSAEK